MKPETREYLYVEADTPTILIGGRAWPIPPLAPRQNRIVTPLVMSYLLPKFSDLTLGAASLDPATLRTFASRLDEPTYDALLKIVHAAMTRAAPWLKREEFDDMPISTPELMDSLEVIMRQTGLFKKAAATGEGDAGNLQNGTTSSAA